MALVGVIKASPGFPPLKVEYWVALVARHPSLSSQKPRRGLNPFTTQPLTIPPRDDAARAQIGGQEVGFFCWTHRCEIDVHALGADAAPVLDLAKELAAKLGAEFLTVDELRRN